MLHESNPKIEDVFEIAKCTSGEIQQNRRVSLWPLYWALPTPLASLDIGTISPKSFLRTTNIVTSIFKIGVQILKSEDFQSESY